MNELDLLITLRDEVPFTTPSPAAQSTVIAAIKAAPADLATPALTGARRGAREPARRTRSALDRSPARSGRPGGRPAGRSARFTGPAIAGALSLTAGAAVIAGALLTGTTGPRTIPWVGRPMMPRPASGAVSLGVARTEAELVDYAARAATLDPGRVPGPHEWVFVKNETAASSAGAGGYLFGPPDRRIVTLEWIRVDRREYAALDATIPATTKPARVVHGHLAFSDAGGGTLGGWKSVSYQYLSSLPTDPARLESVIMADNRPGMPWYARPANVAIFNAVRTLLEGQAQGVRVPPELAAAMYRILQRLPGVHFDAATDLAGRTGLGLYLVVDGWYKEELVIDPKTYLYMGDKEVAVVDHTLTATDGTRHIAKGHVLGWEALLESAIVRHAGQLP